MGDRPRSWDVERPTAPPDHSGLHGGLDPRAPLRDGDRVAWVRRELRRRPGRRKPVERDVERLGVVDEVIDESWLYVVLDGPVIPDEFSVTRVLLPAREVHPRPGR